MVDPKAEDEYKQEYLGGGVSVFCSSTHRFGTDAVLLAYFALKPVCSKKPERIIDLGCGCGIIPLLFARDTQACVQITAVDIQPQAVELCARGIEHSGLDKRVQALCMDLKEIRLKKEFSSGFGLVTMNPPYKRRGSGLMTQNDGLNIARFELECTFDDVCAAAAHLLKPQGRFCVCSRPNRLADMIVSMRALGMEPKRLRCVCQRPGDKPMLVLLEGILGAKPDLDIEPELYLEEKDGALSAEAALIYSKWEYDRKNQKDGK